MHQCNTPINHSVEFVFSSGVLTEHIEFYWIRVKKNKHLKGCHEHKLPGMIPIDDVCIEKGFEIMTMSVSNQ